MKISDRMEMHNATYLVYQSLKMSFLTLLFFLFVLILFIYSICVTYLFWKLRTLIPYAKTRRNSVTKATRATTTTPRKSYSKSNSSRRYAFTDKDCDPGTTIVLILSPTWEVIRPYKLHEVGHAQ